MELAAQLYTVHDYTKNLADFDATLKRISEIFNVSLDELLNDEEKNDIFQYGSFDTEVTKNKVEETAVPVDLFNTKVGDCPRIYHLPIERRWGKYGVIGLLNIEGKTQKYSLNLKELGYDSDCVLYDFWNERFLGI